MKAKSTDSMTEALRVLRQMGELPPAPPQTDSAFPISEDLGELFLAELRSRRERLAKWVELLHAEARRAPAPIRSVARPSHHCRGFASSRTLRNSARPRP